MPSVQMLHGVPGADSACPVPGKEKSPGALGDLYQELVSRDTTMARRTAPNSRDQKQAKEPPTAPQISSSELVDGANTLKITTR